MRRYARPSGELVETGLAAAGARSRFCHVVPPIPYRYLSVWRPHRSSQSTEHRTTPLLHSLIHSHPVIVTVLIEWIRDTISMPPIEPRYDPELIESPSETTTLLPTEDPSTPEQDTSKKAKMSSTLFWRVGAIYGAAAVGLGAFGAHGLKKRISDPNKIASWSTAAHYQVFTPHFLILILGTGILTRQKAGPLGRRPRRESSPRRLRPLHRRHDHVQRQHLRLDFGHGEVQVLGPCDSHWGCVSDCGLVGAGFCEQGSCGCEVSSFLEGQCDG